MNIDKIKQQADEETARLEKIQTSKRKAIEAFETFFGIMDTSYPLWNAKMKKAVDQFVSDFKDYFAQNGFTVQGQNPFGGSGMITELIATYKGVNFKLSNINYDGEHMYIQNFDDISEEIWIALPTGTPNYFVWKDNLVVGQKRLIDMSKPVKEVYKEFVDTLETEDEIKQLVEKIGINTKHFQESIDNIDTIDLCIHRFNTDDTYKDFKAFIEAVDNK